MEKYPPLSFFYKRFIGSNVAHFYLFILLSLSIGTEVIAQTTVSYTATGSGTWTVPCGVTSITVECWGGGGGGGKSFSNTSTAGGGGCGGGYVKTTYAVTPGTVYNYFVGTGGTTSTSNTGSAAVAGTASWFNSASVLQAGGGSGGYGSTTTAGNAGAGGTFTSGNINTGGTGAVSYNGGAGAAGNGATQANGGYGGGGGSSGGSGGAAVAATGSAGATAPAGGGSGGGGGTGPGATGSNGVQPGGGAGGGYRSSSGSNEAGGTGGNGQINITYTIAAPVITSLSSTTGCQGSTLTINGTNFCNVSAVNIGGTAASFTVVSSTQITAVVGAGTTGMVQLVATAGNATSTATYTVYPIPGTVAVSGGGIYCGSATLTASDIDGNPIYWQGTTSGGTSTATPSSSQTVTSSGTYYFNEYNGGCWGTQGSASVVVSAIPSAPGVSSPDSICADQSFNLTATVPAGDSIRWWTAATGGTLLATVPGTSPYMVSPGSNTTYYAEAVSPASSGIDTFEASGTWTVPSGVTTATIYLWGGGGGAGGSKASTSANYWGNGGGGGGGACALANITGLAAGNTYTVTIGAGGTGGTSGTIAGTAGGTTTFTGTAGTWTAGGGSGGTPSPGTTGSTYAGGAGGSVGTGTGIIVHNGGAGSSGYDGNSTTTGYTGMGGGAGGSGAAATSSGTGCSFIGTGGTGTYPGGNGALNADCGLTFPDASGFNGNVPGGGGSGANDYSGTYSGGSGANGMIIITHSGLPSCTSATRTPVLVKVLQVPGAVTVSGAGTFCGSTVLTATDADGKTIYWQGTTNGGTSTATPSASQTVTASGTYYFNEYNGTCWGTQGSAAVTIYAIPAAPAPATATPATVCTGNYSQLSAISTSNTINWWTAATGGTLLGNVSSGANYTAGPSATTTYYAEADNNNCLSTSRTPVTVTVVPTPGSVTVSGGGNYCGTAILTASDTDGNQIYWQGTNSGGTSTGTPSTSQTITSSGTYYFNEYNGTCWGTQGGAIVVLQTVPSAPGPVTATPTVICAGSSALLNAVSPGNSINWWTAATGGIKDTTVSSSTNYSVSPASTTTYYAESQTSNAYDTVRIGASGSWTVPAGVTGGTVYLWGGGGGAGGGTVSMTSNYWGNGGAGGGGACSVNSVPLTPGQVWTATIGAGGAAGNGAASCTTCTHATAGGTTTFVNGGTTLSASGGGPGVGATGTTGGTYAGGAGGSTGTGTVYAGGSGSTGYNGNATNTGYTGTGGGAGGSAGGGTTPAAGCGGTGTGGAGTFPGGTGGNNPDCGTYTGLAGSPGSIPGGGGGGDNTFTTGRLYGGAGGAGEVIIVYPIPTTTTSGCPSTTRVPVTVTVNPAPSSASISDVIQGCNGGHTATVNVSGGIAPYTFTLSCGGTYTTAVPYSLDAGGANSCTITAITDHNGCAPVTVSGNPVTYPTRTLTTGNSEGCTVASGATQIFFDTTGNLMAKVTAGVTTLGSTTVVASIDSFVRRFGPTNPQSYLQRHFQITPANQGPATICIYTSDAEVSQLNDSSAHDLHTSPAYYQTFMTNFSNAEITQYDGGAQTPLSHTSRTVITGITATHNPTVDGATYNNAWQVCYNVSGFSGFYISALNQSDNPLPVTLISFTAEAVNNSYIALNWATASELDNSGFQIQRSDDGTNYQNIAWVDGHGTTTVQNNYQYDDLTVMPNIIYYYRLKQEDVDGQFAYTNIASASLTGSNGFVFADLIPNPATTKVSLGVISNISEEATVTITDMLGREIMNEKWQLSMGYNTSVFDLTKYAGGAYTVAISSGNLKTSKRLVITK